MSATPCRLRHLRAEVRAAAEYAPPRRDVKMPMPRCAELDAPSADDDAAAAAYDAPQEMMRRDAPCAAADELPSRDAAADV